MKLRKLAVAAAVAAALGAGMVGKAQADAMAQSVLIVNDFTLFQSVGDPFTLADFTNATVNFIDTLTNTAVLVPGGFDAQVAVGNTFTPVVDAPQACVGACVSPENNFAPAPVPPGSTYARSDSILAGVPIVVPMIPLGADAATIAEVSLNSTAQGGANSNIQLTSNFSFVLAQPADNILISFSASEYLRAWTSLDSENGTSASANVAWTLTLQQGGTTLVSWAPNGVVGTGTAIGLQELADACDLNTNVSAGFAEPNAPLTCSGTFLARVTVPLQAGVTYSFAIGHTSQAQAVNVVPEPSSLALLGLGLLGFWAGRRKWA